VFGLGLGAAMQVLTIAVQNTVAYHEMGTVTSGVTFFRTLGSSFGTAIFGTLYTARISSNLATAVAQAGVPASAVQSPEALRRLPAAQAAPIIDAYAHTINYVFEWVVPIAALALVVSFLLKEVPLRDSARAGVTDLGDGFGAPESADAQCRLERAVANVLRRSRDRDHRQVLAASGTGLPAQQAWALAQIHMYSRRPGGATLKSIGEGHRVPHEVLVPAFEETQREGYAVLDADGRLALTAAGQAQMDQLKAAWWDWLGGQLDDWDQDDPADRALLERAMDHIAEQLRDEEEQGRLNALARV
jgi:hypothetical protein